MNESRESVKAGSVQAPAPDARAAILLTALRTLSAEPHLSQRELSRALGLSLGKTNYVLHALLDKGLLKVQNFRRADNKLAYAYLLTPRGMKEKLEMTRAFLASKEVEFEKLTETIEQLRSEVQRQRTPDSQS